MLSNVPNESSEIKIIFQIYVMIIRFEIQENGYHRNRLHPYELETNVYMYTHIPILFLNYYH